MALDLSGLTQDQQFEKAAEFAGVPASALRGMWRVESGEGSNLRSAAGARGHFQTMPTTQVTWETRTGRKYNPDDFTDSLTLAALTMEENMRLAKGDLPTALRIYHGGTDRRNWGPVNATYAGKVLGVETAMEGSSTASTTRGVSFDAAWRGDPLAGKGNKAGRAAKERLSDIEKGVIDKARVDSGTAAALAGHTAVADVAATVADKAHDNLPEAVNAAIKSFSSGDKQPVDDADLAQKQADRAAAVAIEQEAFVRAQDYGDYWGAAFSSTLTAQAMRLYDSQDIDQGYQKGWRYIDHMDDIETPDMGAREREMLREANNPADVDRIKGEIEQMRHDQRVLGTMGTAGQVTWGIVGGITDPLGWVAGLGVGKAASLAGVGTRAYIAAGRPIAATLASGGEGVVGNLVTSASLDAMGQYRSTGDYIEDAGFGLLFGTALGIPGARDAHINDLAQSLIRDGSMRKVDLAVRAQNEAGPNATPESLAQIMQRLEGEDDAKWLQANLGDIPDTERLFARPDVGPRPEAPPVMMVDEVIPDRFVATVKDGDVQLAVRTQEDGARAIEVVDENGEPLKDSLGRDAGRMIFSDEVKEGQSVSVRVSPEFQRRGIATAMYKLAQDLGGDVGDAQTGTFRSGATATRSEEGQAFRANANTSAAQVRPLTEQVAQVESAGKNIKPNYSVFKNDKAREAVYSKYNMRERFNDDQNATRIQVAEVIGRAERILSKNNIDSARLQTLLKKVDLEATSTTLLSSDSPVAKAVGIMLTENPEGAAGRRATAALDRSMRFEQYMGTTLRDADSIYQLWRKEQGVGGVRAVWDGESRSRFDKMVAQEMDRRWNKVEGVRNVHPLVKAAADVYDIGYKRMGAEQIRAGVVGAERIDLTTNGYFQRHWNLGAISQLGRDAPKRTAFLNMLRDQFTSVAELYGDEFVDALAIKYLQRLEHRAAGMVEAPANLFSDDSAVMLRESLTALKMNEEEIQKVVSRFSRGGASHTKGRIDMDLNKAYDDGAGGTLTALDFMDHNLPDLYRKYAARVSGDVALAKYGIMGDAGARTLREALVVTGADAKALRAYDQFMAEMMGRPFNTGDNKYLANARVLTGASRLGGALFPQLGAYADAVIAVGLNRTMRAIFDIPRLHAEVRALARGQRVPNGVLDGLETLGPDFGMTDYRIFGLYDVADATEIYGKESIGVVTRAIRGSGNAVRIMSGHRAITAVQTRGMAEQIVQKAWRYIRNGGDDKALEDMGINAALRDDLRKHMDEVVEWDEAGNVKVFDPRKVGDGGEQAMIHFRNSVWRGAGQIIQREFAGETGKWAHNGLLKSLFQFRTFSLVAHQKQFGRQFAVHGTSRALAYLLGAASFAAPIHMTRAALRASLLPEDQRDKYLEEQLQPVMLARATMNYVGTLGMLPDVLDAVGGASAGWADTAGVELPKLLKPTGGRTMANGDVLGDQFAPSLGVVNDLAQGLAGRPGKLVRALPGNNLPYLQPLWLAGEAELKD